MRTSNLIKVMGVFLVVFIVILGLPALASGEDSPPQIPMVLSGIAYINGNAANDGTVIIAKINGIEIKRCTTYTSGTQKGNFALTFTYQGNSNADLCFFIGNNEAAEKIPLSEWLGQMGIHAPVNLHFTGSDGGGGGDLPVNYILVTQVNPAGGGTISRNPAKDNYDSNEVVTLTALPAGGYTFTGWSGDASGTNSQITITMNGNKSVTANFSLSTVTQPVQTIPTRYYLTINSDHGKVTKSPDKANYEYGENVQLTVTPDNGWIFTGWTGNLSGTANPATITMNSDKNVTANYSPNNGQSTTSPSGSDLTGKVDSNGKFITDVTIISGDGKGKLIIPSGTQGTVIGVGLTQISIVPMVNPPPLPDGCGILSLIYDFGPSGAVFDKPVTIVLEYDPASLCPGTSEDSIYIAWFDTNINQWIKLESVVDTIKKTVSAQVTHFTAFAAMCKNQTTVSPEPSVETTSNLTSTSGASKTGTTSITTTTEGAVSPFNWTLLTGIVAAMVIAALVAVIIIMQRKKAA